MLVLKGTALHVFFLFIFNVFAIAQEGIGLIAINDSFCLEGQIYQILRKNFRNQPYYTDILDLFHEVSHANRLCDHDIMRSFVLSIDRYPIKQKLGRLLTF